MKIRRKFLLLTALCFLFAGSVSHAAIPGISPDRYIKTYILGDENIHVYTSEKMDTWGTANPYREYDSGIYPSTEVRVYEIRDDWAYVAYSTFWAGWREGYIPVSALTSRNFSKDGRRCGGILKQLYKRPGGEHYTASSIYRNDLVYTVAREGDFVQILYPITDGYKMVWISVADYEKYVAHAGEQPDPEGAAERIHIQLAVPYLSGDVLVRSDSGGDAPEIGADQQSLFVTIAMKYSYQNGVDITPATIRKSSIMRYVELFPEGMKELGYEYLNYYHPIENSTLRRICTSLSYDRPVIVGGQGRNGEHWVLVTGFDGFPNGIFSPGSFSIHDPTDATKKTLGEFLAEYPEITRVVY